MTKDDIPNEPMALTHLLAITIDSLAMIATALYDKGEQDVGMEVEDAQATLEIVRRQCKDKRL